MPFFLNFAGKRKAVPVFSVFGCAHRSCGGSAGGGKNLRQKAHLKAALMFCHVPQCDVMVPAQIEKTLRFTARHTNPHTAFPENLSPLQTHTPFSALE